MTKKMNCKLLKVFIPLTIVLFVLLRSPTMDNAIVSSANKSMIRWTSTILLQHQPCSSAGNDTEQKMRIKMNEVSMETIESENFDLITGGRYKPASCIAKEQIAVIVPYRDRLNHLRIFLRHIHPFLQRQQLEYTIYVIEMPPDIKFNRALLLNVGFIEALKEKNYSCFIFHDVDLLPENDGIKYTCNPSPQHLAVAIDKNEYKMPYLTYFGGVNAIAKEHFEQLNGFSNLYFGWGGEDDDLEARCMHYGFSIFRLSPDIYRYKMIPHVHDEENPDKLMLHRTARWRFKTDGLNSLKYNVTTIQHKRLFTWIKISVNETEIINTERYSKHIHV